MKIDISGIYMNEPHVVRWLYLHNAQKPCYCLRCRVLRRIMKPVSLVYNWMRRLENGGWKVAERE